MCCVAMWQHVIDQCVLCAVQNVYFNVKGKVIPLQAQCGPEGG